jgi:deoxyribodipyrimidine photo-lyase
LCEEEVATTIFQDFYSFHTSTLIHPEDLDFEITELPDIFTKFRHKVEKNLKIRTPFPKPTQIPKSPKFESESQIKFFEGISSVSFSPHSAILFKGGTHQAQIRLNYYLDESHKVSTYKETRNQMVGEGYSTKFSAWLANGSISPRSIYSALKKYESKFGANDSTYWVFFELLWRDYFKFVFMKYGSKPFQKGGIKGIDNHLNLNINVLQKWKNGKTADDFVNANMIELKETGFMSNRGRQNVASFWVHNLKQDWRAAAAWFESQLIDYDACSNYGNWNYIAGIGNDPRENRVFNVQKQAQMYDSEREFRDLWLND